MDFLFVYQNHLPFHPPCVCLCNKCVKRSCVDNELCSSSMCVFVQNARGAVVLTMNYVIIDNDYVIRWLDPSSVLFRDTSASPMGS